MNANWSRHIANLPFEVRKSDFLVTKSIMINDAAPFVRVRVNSKWTLGVLDDLILKGNFGPKVQTETRTIYLINPKPGPPRNASSDPTIVQGHTKKGVAFL